MLSPIRSRHAELAEDPGYVRSVLSRGHADVRPIARATVDRARAAIGLISLELTG